MWRIGLRVTVAGVCASSFVASASAAVRQETVSGFRGDIQSARQVVAACGAKASGCNADGLPADARVSGSAARPEFNADWEWLRDALVSAKKAPAQKRADAMQAAEDHLKELAAESSGGGSSADQATFEHAKQIAAGVLAGEEFRAAEGPSWLDRQIAKVEDWLERMFFGMANVGARNPWIAPLIEWICFGLAAGGLVFFVRRSLARQTLRIALSESAAMRGSDRDATDWARLAEERAAAKDWRDAVHCLYWAGIVSLESRQAWRPNPTRTPREYVRLLRPGSEAQRLLRDLTGRFERAWYGHGSVDEAEFRAAQASFAALRTAELRNRSIDATKVGSAHAAAGAA